MHERAWVSVNQVLGAIALVLAAHGDSLALGNVDQVAHWLSMIPDSKGTHSSEVKVVVAVVLNANGANDPVDGDPHLRRLALHLLEVVSAQLDSVDKDQESSETLKAVAVRPVVNLNNGNVVSTSQVDLNPGAMLETQEKRWVNHGKKDGRKESEIDRKAHLFPRVHEGVRISINQVVGRVALVLTAHGDHLSEGVVNELQVLRESNGTQGSKVKVVVAFDLDTHRANGPVDWDEDLGRLALHLLVVEPAQLDSVGKNEEVSETLKAVAVRPVLNLNVGHGKLTTQVNFDPWVVLKKEKEKRKKEKKEQN